MPVQNHLSVDQKMLLNQLKFSTLLYGGEITELWFNNRKPLNLMLKYLDISVLCDSHDVVLDLNGQLTGRGQHKPFKLGQLARQLVLWKGMIISDFKIELDILDNFYAASLKVEYKNFLTHKIW
jgi:hypothetical protein